jgi:hypothetical protein
MRTKPTTNTPEPASGIKKVSFGAIGAKKEAKKTTEYPAYPDANGAAAEIAARILERTEQWEALDSRHQDRQGRAEANGQPVLLHDE